MIVRCPKCKAKLSIPDDKADKPTLRLQCPGCTLKFPLGKGLPAAPITVRQGTVGETPATAKVAPTPASAAPTTTIRRPVTPRAAESKPEVKSGMQALLGGVIAAAVGTVVWALIAAFLDREIGWVAWGIGALVGAGVRQGLNDNDTATGLCAGLAIASILCGKLLAFHLVAPNQIAEFAGEMFTQDNYDELKRDAEGFVKVDKDSPKSVSRFMIDFGYADPDGSVEIDAASRAAFLTEVAPNLEDFGRRMPTFESWKKDQIAKIEKEVLKQSGFVDRLKEMLGPLDLVFIGLGVWTAIKVGAGGGA